MCIENRKAYVKMELLRKIVSNGYIALFPILLWNFLLTSKLPSAYDANLFNRNIPFTIIIGENLFRFIIFFLPLFFRLSITSSLEKKGLVIFFFGIVLYFSSWLMLVYVPNSGWSNSVLGFTAPAYTPIIWLVGLSLMVDSYYFKFAYSKWHFILPAIAFSIFHVSHSVYVYSRTY